MMELLEEMMEQVCAILKKKTHVEEIQSDSILKEYGVDSYQIMEVIVEVEMCYHIEFSPEVLIDENLKRIRSISSQIASALRAEKSGRIS